MTPSRRVLRGLTNGDGSEKQTRQEYLSGFLIIVFIFNSPLIGNI